MKGEKRRDMFNLDFRIVLVTSDSKTVTKRNRLVIKFFFDNFSAIRIMHFKLLFEHIFSLCTFLPFGTIMALPVVEFSRQGYKIGKVFA